MNKNNDINVFTYGYIHEKRFIWQNIKQFFRNIKYAWQRATKGYCSQDIWNLDYFLTIILRDTIKELAYTTHVYPGDNTAEGSSEITWDRYLNEISLLLDQSIERSFGEEKYYFNPYTKDYSEYLNNLVYETEELPDGSIKLINNKTKEEKLLCKNYFKEELKIYKQRVADRNTALDMLKKHWDNLWD